MERTAVRAEVYRLLAGRLFDPDWDQICSGEWAEQLTRLLSHLDVSLVVPASLGACTPEAAQANHAAGFAEPKAPIRPVESLYKPWSTAPDVALPIARETGWLGGDSAAHMKHLFTSLGVQLPRELEHAPDHLVLELEFMAMLLEQGTPEQAALFRSQHLDWIADLLAAAEKQQAPEACIDLIRLVSEYVALDQ